MKHISVSGYHVAGGTPRRRLRRTSAGAVSAARRFSESAASRISGLNRTVSSAR